MNHQYDPSLLDNVPPSIFLAATAVSNWFNSQSLDPSPRWEFLSICSRNHADRLNKLERELNEANKTISLQHELMTTAEKRGVDKAKEELNEANQRIKQLESENDALRADLLLWEEKEAKP